MFKKSQNFALFDDPSQMEPLLPSEYKLGALLEQAGVAALSGTAFGAFGEGYLRLSIANSFENLELALERIGNWAEKNL